MFDSLVYPLAKAVCAQRGDVPRRKREGDWAYAWLLVPLVVVAAPLYVVDTTTSAPAVEQVGNVTLIRELKSRSIEGEFAIEFVARASLHDFITSKVLPVCKLCGGAIRQWRW